MNGTMHLGEDSQVAYILQPQLKLVELWQFISAKILPPEVKHIVKCFLLDWGESAQQDWGKHDSFKWNKFHILNKTSLLGLLDLKRYTLIQMMLHLSPGNWFSCTVVCTWTEYCFYKSDIRAFYYLSNIQISLTMIFSFLANLDNNVEVKIISNSFQLYCDSSISNHAKATSLYTFTNHSHGATSIFWKSGSFPWDYLR